MGSKMSNLCSCVGDNREAGQKLQQNIFDSDTNDESNCSPEKANHSNLKDENEQKLKDNALTIPEINGKSSNIQAISYENGDSYTGETINSNIKHGVGKLTIANGHTYEGEFQNDLFDGSGRLVTAETVYIGHFEKGKKCGMGVSESLDKAYRYEGEWMLNKRNGFGKEFFPDHSYYEGSFLNGKKNGSGKLCLQNGSIYIGEFKDDKIEGNGMFKWSDDKIYKGQWVNNCLSGFGSFIQGNKKYIGHFVNDKKHGLGINYYLNSNSFLIGNWAEDSMEGLAMFVVPEKTEQFWKMSNNKMVAAYSDPKEIEILKKSKDYLKIENFYFNVICNNPEYSSDKFLTP